ncbi:MAG: ATP-binding protein [Bacilli bacterium]|nr:ATP-binding protein [Bacilli bacterium]MDD4077271.1 ATP-binding protein [Bacilli bacterium]
MYIKRLIEERLEKVSKMFHVILVTGPRQVGKSTLLKNKYKQFEYITFDDPLLLSTTIQEPGLFFKNHEAPIIIDEIQYAPTLLAYIKMASDNSEEYGNFFLTGSQQFHLMKNVSESLAGRVSILELQGLSAREIYNINFNKHFIPNEDYIIPRKKNIKDYKNIWNTIHKGSYPAMYKTEIDWTEFYSSYIRTYLERDINDLINIKDQILFMNFLTALAARTGEMLNYENIASEVGVSSPTIKNWISVLETSGIIYLLQPYTPSVLKRAIKTPKLYFRDTGLVCYLTKWMTPETLKVGAKNGNIFETYVISEIIKSYTNEGKDYRGSIFYYRGKDKTRKLSDGSLIEIDSEIDLIIEENNILHPVEIKMSANPKQEMANAFNVLDEIKSKKRGTGAIICLYDKLLYLKEDLVVLPIEYI